MEEIKQGWKKRISWLLIALIVVIVYKMLDNFSNIQEWFGSFFRIMKPFLIGLLISYILFMPCKKIESILLKSKFKFINKKARGLSVIATYIIFVLIIIVIINCIFPILKESVVELVGNIPGYYETLVNKYRELPEDSVLKSDIIKDKMAELSNIDMKQLLSINNEKIIEYVKNIIDVFSGIFDVFVSIIVSVYILLQRTTIMKFLRRFARALFKKNTYEAVNKYFTKANEVFFTFISSQLLDAVIVGILTTVAMLIIKVKYAPLIGFTIGLFNMIPYIGAIVAVAIGILITFITGGLGKALAMAIVVIILQQIDANIINPKIIGVSLEVSPLLVIFSVTVGGAYFGILGMFLGVPIAVVIKTVLTDWIDNKNKFRDEQEKMAEKSEIE
ncbi:MAG: AI-2E family transporter [Clostridia bacterium]